MPVEISLTRASKRSRIAPELHIFSLTLGYYAVIISKAKSQTQARKAQSFDALRDDAGGAFRGYKARNHRAQGLVQGGFPLSSAPARLAWHSRYFRAKIRGRDFREWLLLAPARLQAYHASKVQHGFLEQQIRYEHRPRYKNAAQIEPDGDSHGYGVGVFLGRHEPRLKSRKKR